MILLVYIFSTLQHTHKQACNQDFAKGVGLEAENILFENASTGLRAEQSGATKSFHIDGSLGVKPLSLGDLLIFFYKRLLFQRHLDHISQVFKVV